MKHVQFDGANFENVDFRSCTFLRGASFHGITITKGNLDLRGVMVGDPNRSDLPTLIGFAGFRLAPYSTIKLWLELSYGACALFNQGCSSSGVTS